MYLSELHPIEDGENEQAKSFLEEGRSERIKNEIAEIVEDEFSRLAEYASESISGVAAGRAESFLVSVLNGDDDAAMRLFGDRSGSSRYRTLGCDKGKPWSSLIHGHLFETGGVKLRRKIVEAHQDLLISERVRDLESIVDGLEQQVKKQDNEIERLHSRY